MNIQAVFSDIDDTLLISGQAPSDKLKATINRLHEKNILFVPLTGRPFMGLQNMQASLNLTDYLCGYNGAYAFDIKNNQVLLEYGLHKQDIEKLTSFLSEHKINFALYDEEKKRIVTTDARCEYLQFEARMNDLPVEEISFAAIQNIKSIKILAFSEPEQTAERVALLQKHFSEISKITISKPFFIEINNHQASKGNCILQMCQHLNIDIHNIFCFGDSLNDLEMFEVTPNSVAVANAKPEILKLAKYQTLSVEEDGFSALLDPLLS